MKKIKTLNSASKTFDEKFVNNKESIDSSLHQDYISYIGDTTSENFDYNGELRLIINEAMKFSSKTDSDKFMAPKLHKLMMESGLTKRFASKMEIWHYMSCVEYKDFVYWRFKPENKPISLNRLVGAQNRNTFSRLWLWAELTYDDKYQYKYTTHKDISADVIMYSLDTIMPRNKKILIQILKYITDHDLKNQDSETRPIFIHYRAKNATTKLALYDEDDIYEDIDNFMKNINPHTSTNE